MLLFLETGLYLSSSNSLTDLSSSMAAEGFTIIKIPQMLLCGYFTMAQIHTNHSVVHKIRNGWSAVSYHMKTKLAIH